MDQEQMQKRKKAIYGLICDKMYVPMKIKEIAMLLSVPKSERHELEEVLNALIDDGKVQVSAKGKYAKAKGNLLTGTFIGHARGYGFVQAQEGEDDIFIPSDQLGGAFHKDIVQVAVAPVSSGKRREGKVVKIISRGTAQVIGTYEAGNSYGFVIPDDPKIGRDIFVPKERAKGAADGHKVVVQITDYGKAGKKPEGKILEILGHKNDPGTDIAALIKAYEIPVEFPEKVLNQAVRVAKDVSEADRAGRVDLRDLQMVTIDGEDAKDLDDAVSLTREGGVYCLGVHIADVTNYVQEYSALDCEAAERGTSVYLVDRVIPMLPHTLSNGICSLNAGEDRLALSCMMKIDEKGKVIDHTIAETVIRVDRRMSYTAVNKILEDPDSREANECGELVPMLTRMGALALILRKKRMQRGSIDFDFPETKIRLDAGGHPVEIKPYERNAATRLIEDFMLIANETVAEHFFWQQTPFVYRTHETPDPEKIRRLALFINNFGYSIHIGKIGRASCRERVFITV